MVYCKDEIEMKKILAVFVFIVFSGQAWAQTEGKSVDKDTVYSIQIIDEAPIYPGCEDQVDHEERLQCFNRRILQFISMETIYPEKARKENLMGKVWVSFVIGENGEIKDVVVLKGEHESLNNEAIRIIKKLPKCTPAQKDGVPVSVKYTVPINFRLG